MDDRPQASFAAELKRLHEQSGNSLTAYGLPKVTVKDLIDGKFTAAPPWDRVHTIVVRCEGDVDRWRKRHARLEADVEQWKQRQRTGPTIGEWNPAMLGVHKVIAVEGAQSDELTPYVLREHDEVLRKALRDGHRLIVLTGTSCTGKTRAALEAVRAELPELPVIRPMNAGELVRRAEKLTGRCVLWLNEIHRFLTDEAVEVLASAPNSVRVLGTTRTSHWDDLVDEDGPHHSARELLVAATQVEVAESFTAQEMEQLSDARMVFAARVAEDGKLVQALSGGPELLRMCRDPRRAVFKALVTAAVDGVLLSGAPFVPRTFLEASLPGYLEAGQRADARFDDGIAQTTKPVRGISALTGRREAPDLGPPDHFEPHEFLVQQIGGDRKTVPGATWQAFLDHVHEPSARLAVARSAMLRGYRRIAMCALWPMTDDGKLIEEVWRSVLRPHRDAPHPDLRSWLVFGAERGDNLAMWTLASDATERGDREEAAKWWRRELEVSQGRAMSDQIGALERIGLLEEAITWLHQQTLAGTRTAVDATVSLLHRVGRNDEAIELLLPLASDGDRSAVYRLGALYSRTGNEREAQRWQAEYESTTPSPEPRTPVTPPAAPSESTLRTKVAQGGRFALNDLSRLLRKTGRAAEALDLWKAEAEAGQHVPMLHYTEILLELGRAGDAIAWLEQRANSIRHVVRLAWIYRKTGDDQAEQVWSRRAALAGDSKSARRLAKAHREAGEIKEAIEVLRPSAERDPAPEADLVDLLPEVGRAEEAETRMRKRLETGVVAGRTFELATFLRRQGRAEEAAVLEIYGIEPGGSTAKPWRAEPPA
ncbi:tetratricopeptide repeat protein [Lentzea aerocolonigenes]|uniref:tetratricopeptide repeat protein n=1 Tax=Lentzea aerocolonigenes TaxID=68170 RepID=UPI000AA5AC92|nr:tetratricopeptide repeat protein [Lentzea aerocolonigenes]MCP2242128.1 hypothetical protein [Lentzea aerocolonigenes]